MVVQAQSESQTETLRAPRAQVLLKMNRQPASFLRSFVVKENMARLIHMTIPYSNLCNRMDARQSNDGEPSQTSYLLGWTRSYGCCISQACCLCASMRACAGICMLARVLPHKDAAMVCECKKVTTA
eukprot:6199941-Pleurochrysis_carterae.AAC.2